MKTLYTRITSVFIFTCLAGVFLFPAARSVHAGGDWAHFWDREFYTETGGFGVISNVPEREHQYFATLALVYEKPALYKHYSTGFFVMPVWYHSPGGHINGVTFGIMDRFWLDPECRHGLFMKFHIGALLTNKKFIMNDSTFNYYSSGGFGYQWNDPDLFIHVAFQHISNGDRRSPNLGINAYGLTLGYRF